MIPSISDVGMPKGKARIAVSLVLYGLPPLDESPKSDPPQCTVLAILHLPPFSDKVDSARISNRSDPAPCPQAHPQTASSSSLLPKPFYPDPLKRIFVISLEISTTSKPLFTKAVQTLSDATLFVHSDAFVKLLGRDVLESGQLGYSATHSEFKWDDWSQYARWTAIVPQETFSEFRNLPE